MKKSFRISITILLVIAVLATGGVLSFLSVMSKSPEKVTATVQQQLQRNLGVPVTIDRARFEWKRGPRVILSGVVIDEPGAITCKIRSITAYLSVWRLLLGDVVVRKARLIMPSGTVNLDKMKEFASRDETMPTILIWKGTLKIICRGVDIPLTDVSGRITHDWANLRARILGGRVLLETDLERPGELTFDAYAVQLDQLDENLRGTAYMNISAQDTKNGISGSLSLQVKGMRHPWVNGTLDRLVVSASLDGSGKIMKITDIAVKTPIIEMSGRGELRGWSDKASWKDAELSLEASSKEFDYEKAVAALPVERFPWWLRNLLTRQIRSGRSRFASASYKGPVRGFFSGDELLDNIHVVQELKGQSFSAGRTTERLTGITGQVIYSRGDIGLRNLSGMLGSSRLDRVDIVFPGAVRPLMRVGVDVDIDMSAQDFMRAWQVLMVPGEVHRILAGVSKVSEGHITGRVNTYYDEAKRNPFTSRGDIRLSGCAFTIGGHGVTGLSGTIHSDAFQKPQIITLSGVVDRVRVRQLNVILTAPFGESMSRFTLVADRLPRLGKLTLEDASLRVSGRGRGTDLSGTVDMNAQGMAFAKDDRSYRARSITVQGEFRTRIGKGTGISLDNLVISNPTSRLEGAAEIQGEDGRADLSGRIDLGDITMQGPRVTRRLAGSVGGDISLSWGRAPATAGRVNLHDAVLPFNDDMATTSGALEIEPSRLSMNRLRVRIKDVLATITGDLTRGDQPRFKGDVTIEGLTVGGKGPALEGLRDISADARLNLVGCSFHGLPLQTASADAQLKDGVLKLDRIVVETVSGKARGNASVSLDGGSSFDVVVALRNADLGEFLNATSGTSAVDGMLDLEGHLWGSAGALNGTIAAHARDGEIRKYALVSQIFSLLNVYRIARNQDADFLSRHFTYNRIDTTLDIRNDVVEFDDFSLDSNSIQVSAVGRYALDSKRIDAVIGVQPLESLDRTIGMIPVVGWVLTGDNGKFIVVSMKVNGTMDDPSVTVAPVETLTNTVAASLLRSLKLPGRLVEESLRVMENGK